MTRKGWIDICTIRKIVETVGCVPHGESLRTLELLHCVHFKDMAPELLREVPALISRVIGGPVLRFECPSCSGTEIDVFSPLPEPIKQAAQEAASKRTGLLSRLLS